MALQLSCTHVLAMTIPLILAACWAFQTHRAKNDTAAVAASTAHQTVSLNDESYAQVPLRILAGYSGKPQIDSAGAAWQSDRGFEGGET
jgi:hypothetical protein